MKIGDWTAGDPAILQNQALRRIKEAALGKPQLFEWQVKRKNDELIWVEANLKSAVIGRNEYVLAVVRDIIERKRAEEALQESEKRYRTIFDNASEGITITQDGVGVRALIMKPIVISELAGVIRDVLDRKRT